MGFKRKGYGSCRISWMFIFLLCCRVEALLGAQPKNGNPMIDLLSMLNIRLKDLDVIISCYMYSCLVVISVMLLLLLQLPCIARATLH